MDEVAITFMILGSAIIFTIMMVIVFCSLESFLNRRETDIEELGPR